MIGKSIHSDTLKEVKLYFMIADEVTDTADKENLSLALSYILNGTIKEVFVDLVEVKRLSGDVAQANNTWAVSSRYVRSVLQWHLRC